MQLLRQKENYWRMGTDSSGQPMETQTEASSRKSKYVMENGAYGKPIASIRARLRETARWYGWCTRRSACALIRK